MDASSSMPPLDIIYGHMSPGIAAAVSCLAPIEKSR